MIKYLALGLLNYALYFENSAVEQQAAYMSTSNLISLEKKCFIFFKCIYNYIKLYIHLKNYI